MNDITEILQSVKDGEGQTAETLLSLVYDELRKLAKARMQKEPTGHTLEPTALVHEAWLKMVGEKDRTWHNRAYFFTVASTAMRRILVDHARRKSAMKHGGDQQRVDIDMHELIADLPDEKTLMVEDALEQLEKVHPAWAKIVVMKYFGGMTYKEISSVMEVSERTVERWWDGAKTWLFNTIRKQS